MQLDVVKLETSISSSQPMANVSWVSYASIKVVKLVGE